MQGWEEFVARSSIDEEDKRLHHNELGASWPILGLNSCLFFPLEFTMTIKETYCSVTNLVPNTQYEFWVTARNRAGLSPASERAVYMTGNGATCFCSRTFRKGDTGVVAFLLWQGS